MTRPHPSVSRPRAATVARRRLTVALAALLVAVGGVAAYAQDIDCNNLLGLHTFNASVGTPVGESIALLNASGNYFWDFSAAPAGCAGASPSFTCSGVTIALPTGSPDNAVPDTDTTDLSGSPTTANSHAFSLVATSEDGMTTCERDFELIITGAPDVAFVLDRSGSMSGSGGVSAPASDRWDALEAGVNAFTPLLQATAPNGRTGLTLFSTSVLANNSFSTGLVSNDAAMVTGIATEMASQSPGGLTAMGAGLKAGMAKLADATRPRVVVLFTDGQQNQSPQVDSDGCGFSDGTDVNPTCPAGDGTVKIVTVGINTPSASYLDTLQNLASNNRGYSLITGNGDDFTGACTGNPSAAFACAVQPALADASPQLVTTASGTLDATPDVVTFDLNQRVDQLLLQLHFDRKFETPTLLQLLGGVRVRRDGEDVTGDFQPAFAGNFGNHVLLRGRFPITTAGGDELGSAASYEVELRSFGTATAAAALRYRLAVFADDHRLDLEPGVEPGTPRVGGEIRPTLDLHWLGRPVPDADVEVLVLKPGDDLGDLLARDPRTVDTISGEDADSPGVQKYHQLIEDPAFLAELLPEEQRLSLTHQGDGHYVAAFDPGDVSGVYQLVYSVDADSGAGSAFATGHVERRAVRSVYVRFAELDLAASDVQVRSGDGTLTLAFRPVSTVGRFLGPGNAAAFDFGGGAEVQSITDHQDGRYTVVLTADADTPLEVSVLGDPLYDGPAGEFGHGGKKRGKCAKWPCVFRWICRLFKGGK